MLQEGGSEGYGAILPAASGLLKLQRATRKVAARAAMQRGQIRPRTRRPDEETRLAEVEGSVQCLQTRPRQRMRRMRR